MAGGTAIYLVLNRLDFPNDIVELIERIGHERVAENLNDAGMNSTNSEANSEEPECVWAVLRQAMTQKSVRKARTGWTDQDSEDRKCFNCVIVRMGDRVINVECTQQDVIALSTIQSESYTLTTGELGRVPSEDNETDLGTKCLEQDHIERCMTKMGMMIVGAWAGEQLLVVSGTGVVTGEDLFEGHSWTMGVALRVTVGVGLLCCVCAASEPHLPTGNVHVIREPEVARQPRGITLRSMRNDTINHVREKIWSPSRYSGDQLGQLMKMLNAQYGRDTLVQLLRRIAIMSGNQTRCSGDDLVWSEFFDWVTGGDDYSYESKLWRHDRIHAQALSEERIGENGDEKRVLVKFSDVGILELEDQLVQLMAKPN